MTSQSYCSAGALSLLAATVSASTPEDKQLDNVSRWHQCHNVTCPGAVHVTVPKPNTFVSGGCDVPINVSVCLIYGHTIVMCSFRIEYMRVDILNRWCVTAALAPPNAIFKSAPRFLSTSESTINRCVRMFVQPYGEHIITNI